MIEDPEVLEFPYPEETMKSQIDELFTCVKAYRSSAEFKKMLDFCCNFRELSAFNAMLVGLQCRNCQYALTKNQWEEQFHRGIGPNARPLLYLNFSPLGILYDISDTYPLPGSRIFSDEEILERVAHPFFYEGEFDHRILRILESNLKIHGIALDENLEASESLSACIQALNSSGQLYYSYRNHEMFLPVDYYFLISVNRHAGPAQRMAAICHELGHFFCCHLSSPSVDWWKVRRVSKSTREFEAEAVSYLVCRRNGIPDQHSEKYLADYLVKNGEIPSDVSVESILNSARYIESMLSANLSLKDGLLYKKDKKFKEAYERNNKRLGARVTTIVGNSGPTLF